ncbi:hypothetical protein DPMN_167490 [Dreissena polymorpha]|uniref:Uncharacterized protein n=1 Tax=Dreissena polymorpha TaxID=45954 RepID=A0A9D4F3Z5_DREPO|nr:hypothetical protein DPMN_167490 [Dreissena polymorpha]
MLNGIWQAETGAITVNFLAETRYTFAFIIVDQNHIRVLMDSFDVMTYKIPVLLANEANTIEGYCNACQVHTISIANNTVH